MEPGGILDSDYTKMLDYLVEKRVAEFERSGFVIITNAGKDKIRDDIKAEIALTTGKLVR